MKGGWTPGAICALVFFAGCLGPAAPAPESPMGPNPAVPVVVAAFGNSLMTGYSADAQHRGNHPELSWPTGSASWSFASLVGATDRQNAGQGGAMTPLFASQIAKTHDVTLALVMFTAPEVCKGWAAVGALFGGTGTSGFTGSDYERELRAGVRALQANGSQVMLLTTPDWVAMAEAGAAEPPPDADVNGAYVYATFQECGKEPGTKERLKAMNDLVVRMAVEEGVLSDGGAMYEIGWSLDMLSTVDHLHPNAKGLETMARAAYEAYTAQVAGHSQ